MGMIVGQTYSCSISQDSSAKNCIGIASYCSVELFFLSNPNELKSFLTNYPSEEDILSRIKESEVSTGKSIGKDVGKLQIIPKKHKLKINPNFFKALKEDIEKEKLDNERIYYYDLGTVGRLSKALNRIKYDSNSNIKNTEYEKKDNTELNKALNENNVNPNISIVKSLLKMNRVEKNETPTKQSDVNKSKEEKKESQVNEMKNGKDSQFTFQNIKNKKDDEREKIRINIAQQYTNYAIKRKLPEKTIEISYDWMESTLKAFGKYIKGFLDSLNLDNRINYLKIVSTIFQVKIIKLAKNELNLCQFTFCIYGIDYEIKGFKPSNSEGTKNEKEKEEKEKEEKEKEEKENDNHGKNQKDNNSIKSSSTDNSIEKKKISDTANLFGSHFVYSVPFVVDSQSPTTFLLARDQQSSQHLIRFKRDLTIDYDHSEGKWGKDYYSNGYYTGIITEYYRIISDEDFRKLLLNDI